MQRRVEAFCSEKKMTIDHSGQERFPVMVENERKKKRIDDRKSTAKDIDERWMH
tara:strand:+ start:124 stop:285 length:162 start_codon:yes stop_codon:yes gene_type:complete